MHALWHKSISWVERWLFETWLSDTVRTMVFIDNLFHRWLWLDVS